MLRRPYHLPSFLSLLVCLAAAVLWFRSAGGRPGDHFGWKRQQMQGREWVREECSALSAGGELRLVKSRSTTGGATGNGRPKARVQFGEEGYFWTDAVEKAPQQTAIDIKKKAPAAAPATATAPATAPAASQPAADDPAEKAFAPIDETTPTSSARGVTVKHWLLVLVTALLPARWLLVTTLRGSRPHGDEPDRRDRVPLLARLFSAAASLSLLLAVVLGVAWAKSWYGGDRLSWRDASRPQFVDVHSGRGQLVAHFRRVDEKLLRTAPDLAAAPNGFSYRQEPEGTVGYTAKLFCFEVEAETTGDGLKSRAVTVAAPYWALLVLALVPPSWWLRNQKFGPIKVSGFGRPAAAKGKPVRPAFVSQRPL